MALNWFVSITSASFFINWMIVAFTSWRFRKTLAAQNDPLFSGLYAWKSSMWPLAPVWLMSVCVLLLICCFYVGAKPPVRPKPLLTVSSPLYHISSLALD